MAARRSLVDVHLRMANPIFDAYPSIELSVLFGSAAMGNARAESDLDIAVLPQRDASLSLTDETNCHKDSLHLSNLHRRSQIG